MKSVLRQYLICSVISFLVVITGCGGGGGGGKSDTSSVTSSDPTSIDLDGNGEGTVDSPVTIPLEANRYSYVGALSSSYYKFSVPENDTYFITLENPTVDVSWRLYSGSNYTGTVESCDKYYSATTESCSATLDGGSTYYLKVSSWSTTGGTYSLSVRKIVSEGTRNEPVSLSIGEVHDGSAGLDDSSYYTFTPNTTGAHVIATNIQESLGYVGVNVYSTSFAATSPVLLKSCSSVCSINSLDAGTAYYVEVISTGSTASLYTISVTEGVSQGTMANPVNLEVGAVEPHAGAVDESGYSYYRFTTGDAGEYILTINDSVYVGALVSNSSDFTSSVTTCSQGDCTLSYLSSNTTYYVRVSNSSQDEQYFQIAVNKGVTEGTSSEPVTIYLDTPYSGAVGAWTRGYYAFQTSDFSGSYTISLTATQTDLSWSLYTEGGYSATYTCNEYSGVVSDEVCVTENLQPNTTYYIRVINNDLVDASDFTLNVSAGGGSEGTYSNPVDLGVVPATGLSYTGQVTNGGQGAGYSYYNFTTGASSAVYQISLSNMSSNLVWELSTTNGWDISTCNNFDDTSEEVCSTQDSLSNTSLDANTTYILSVFNYGDVTTTYDLTLTPYIPSDGCSADAVECLDFEGSASLPVGITQTTNANGNSWKWYVDATESAGQPGTNNIHSGTLGYAEFSCFSYTPAVRPTGLDYSVKTIGGSYSLKILENGSTIGFLTDVLTNGEWMRLTNSLPGGTELLTFEWCISNSSTVSSPDVSFDDIEFR